MIILDFGGGDPCLNEWEVIKDMIDQLAAVDAKRRCIIKWQLFNNIDGKRALKHQHFDDAYWYAKDLGFKTAASVFDWSSWVFYRSYETTFVKISNFRYLNGLLGDISAADPFRVIIKSYDHETRRDGDLCCISHYPANPEEYDRFNETEMKRGISDHTTGFRLFLKYHPVIYEKHYKIPEIEGIYQRVYMKTVSDIKMRPYCIEPKQVKRLLEVANGDDNVQ
jgi:hypothetical protein